MLALLMTQLFWWHNVLKEPPIIYQQWAVPEKNPGGLNLHGSSSPMAISLGGAMNPNDATVIVLKDILLCLFGLRFIYIVYICWYTAIYKTLQMCYYHQQQHACLLLGLPVYPVCLSVKLQWMIQVTKEIQGNSWIQEFKSSGCAVSNNLKLWLKSQFCQSQSKLSQNS